MGRKTGTPSRTSGTCRFARTPGWRVGVLVAGAIAVIVGFGSLATASGATGTATFGKTTVGAASDSMLADRKRVNRYALSEAGTVSKLTIYLQPTGTAGT